MDLFDKKKYILRLMGGSKKGVSIENIIDYLDYVNKVRYDKKDIKETLKELIFENKIHYESNLYFIN